MNIKKTHGPLEGRISDQTNRQSQIDRHTDTQPNGWTSRQ